MVMQESILCRSLVVFFFASYIFVFELQGDIAHTEVYKTL